MFFFFFFTKREELQKFWLNEVLMGNKVVHWLALSPQSKKVQSLNLTADWDLTVWGFHVLPLPVWVSPGYSGFLLWSKDMQIILTGFS